MAKFESVAGPVELAPQDLHERLTHYLQQAERAEQEARRSVMDDDRTAWLRVAQQWRLLHDTLADLQRRGGGD